MRWVGAASVAPASCAGVIYFGCSGPGFIPPNLIDDAGFVHDLDGDVLYGPNVCDGFDASAWSQPAPTCNAKLSEVDPICVAWTAGSYPGGVNGLAICNPTATDAGVVTLCEHTFEPPGAYCVPGDAGDAYCRAFVQPFLRSGSAAYACVHHYMGGPPADWWACDWAELCACDAPGPSDGKICAYTDAGLSCLVPCQ